jgi:hypothetical protein
LVALLRPFPIIHGPNLSDTGTGIALVSALHAKVPVLLHDRSKDQITKGLALIDKLLAKDVGKGRLTDIQAKESRDRIKVVDNLEGLRDVDMVVEVRRPCSAGSSPIQSQWPINY